MNTQYVYKDGKALIIDEEDNQQVIDYYDNLEEVLETENLIEIMEEENSKLAHEVSTFKQPNKFLRILKTILPTLALPGLPFIIFYLQNVLCYSGITVTWPIIGEINQGIAMGIMSLPCFLPMGMMLSAMIYVKDKTNDKYKRSREVQLEYLKKELLNQQAILEGLKQNKVNSRQDEFAFCPINNISILKQLRNFLAFYEELGYNEDKYSKYYQEGKLNSKLKNTFKSEGIELVNAHFEENTSITKKKIRKK